jgi:hypothetical protein
LAVQHDRGTLWLEVLSGQRSALNLPANVGFDGLLSRYRETLSRGRYLPGRKIFRLMLRFGRLRA